MREATGGGGVRYATGFRTDSEAKAYRDAVVAGIELWEMESLFAADDADRSRPGASAAAGGTSRPTVRRGAFCDWQELDALEADGLI
jgi:hypothetical protein